MSSTRRSERGGAPRTTLPALPAADQGRAATAEPLVDDIQLLRDEMRAMRDEIHRLHQELAIVRALATRRTDSLPYRGLARDDD